MARRLRARYRFGRLGGLRVIFSAESLADLSRRRKNLEALFAADRRHLTEYAALKEEWNQARARLSTKQEELGNLAAVFQEQQADLLAQQNELGALLRAIREEQATQQALLAELAESAALAGGHFP